MQPPRFSPLLAVFVAALAITVGASAASDPRVCAAGSAQACSRTAAVVAIKRKVDTGAGRKVWKGGPLACVSPGGSNLVWMCDFAAGHATASFAQSGAGWKVTVRLLCRRPGCL